MDYIVAILTVENKCYSNDINGKLAKNTQEFINNEWTTTMADVQNKHMWPPILTPNISINTGCKEAIILYK